MADERWLDAKNILAIRLDNLGDVLLNTPAMRAVKDTLPSAKRTLLASPVVALFALTNPPQQWGHWRTPYRQLYHLAPCAICYSRVCPTDHLCLRGVAPAEVAQAAAELLGRQQAIEARSWE